METTTSGINRPYQGASYRGYCTAKGSAIAKGHRPLTAATLFACCVILAITASPALAATDKITSSTALVLRTPSQQISEAALLDVGIPTLNDGLYLTDEEDTVFSEVRFAQAIYFSNQLPTVMETCGACGAIRVTPSYYVVMVLYITGPIFQYDVHTMYLDM